MPSQRELSQGMFCFFALGNHDGSEHLRAHYLAWKRVTILYLGYRTYVSLRGRGGGGGGGGGGNRALITLKYGMLVCSHCNFCLQRCMTFLLVADIEVTQLPT